MARDGSSFVPNFGAVQPFAFILGKGDHNVDLVSSLLLTYIDPLSSHMHSDNIVWIYVYLDSDILQIHPRFNKLVARRFKWFHPKRQKKNIQIS